MDLPLVVGRCVSDPGTRHVSGQTGSMLELRPNCELCDADLPPDAPDARICTYECTFCAHCVERVLHDVCPNCGGGFVPRPIRPRHAWRATTGLVNDPPGTTRRRSSKTSDQIRALTERLRGVPPDQR
jgi:uncharacterized protein